MEENYTQVFGEGDYEKFEGKACFDRVSNCDLIPSNILYKDNKIYIIDYEWVFDFSVPVEYIYFRGLNLFEDKTLVQQYIDNEILEELFRQEEYFILQYVFKKRVILPDSALLFKKQDLYFRKDPGKRSTDHR